MGVRRYSFIVFSILFLLLIIFLTLVTNQHSLSIKDILLALIGNGSTKADFIIWNIRIPRMVMMMLVGAALSISGCIFQALTHNELAEPGLLGVNTGSMFMMMIFLLTIHMDGWLSMIALPAASFIGGIAVAAVLLIMMARGNLSGKRIIINGIAINSFLTSVIIIMTLKLNETQLDFFISFNAGTLYSASWIYIWILMPIIFITIGLIYQSYHWLDIALLDHDSARNLGYSSRMTYTMMTLATILSSLSISVAGGIAIIGLVAPHITRLIIGTSHKHLLYLSAIIGMIITTISDYVSQYILDPKLPTGVVIILFCTPYLIYKLIIRRSLL